MSTSSNGIPIAPDLSTPAGYSPLWIDEKVHATTSQRPRPSTLLHLMTRPIDATSGFWNTVEKITRILTLTVIPWGAWVTLQISAHSTAIQTEQQWRRDHNDMTKERLAQIDRMDKELQEWRIKFNIFTDETRNSIRSTDTSVREVAARIGLMSETLIRMQENQAAIKEKMISLQVLTDELNKK